MQYIGKTAAALVAAMALAYAPSAGAGTMGAEATKLRKLDIMLMVGSLRCRFGADDFRTEYERFADNQSATMIAAARELEADYTAELGSTGARKALDSLSVGMANQYGQGHPWLGCAALKSLTQDLAVTTDRTRLLAAADYSLGTGPTIAMGVAQ